MKDKLSGLGELGMGSRLNRLSGLVMRETQEVYHAMKIDFDPYLFPIFKLIIDTKEITTTDIQEALQYTQPAITQAIHKLTDKGYIAYKNDESDKRKKLFYVSKKGNDIREQLLPIWNIIDQEVKLLTCMPTKSMVELLGKIERSMSEKSLSRRILERL